MCSNLGANPFSYPPKGRTVSWPSTKWNLGKYGYWRQLGMKTCLGHDDVMNGTLYGHMDEYCLETQTNLGEEHGGIFNLEFSLDGRLLVAACERNSVLIHDAHNQKLIKVMKDAHSNCVNCIRFLNDRSFATCSDDNSIKLWDTRNVKRELKTMNGHSNWVKNIEYSEKDNVLITSAFDGSIYAWDLSNHTENSYLYEKIFLMNGLMRTKLSPDGTKMVISTTSGYMIVVHDLNLSTLASDFRSFKPLLYRLMQISGQSFPSGTIFNHLFHPTKKRNRVEFIDDFTIDAEVISSLQIHPYTWNAVSRSLSADERDEVTSVHDIQKRDLRECEDCFMYMEEDGDESESDDSSHQHPPSDLWLAFISNRERHHQVSGGPQITEEIQLPTMGIINSGLIGTQHVLQRNYFRQHPEEKNKVVVNAHRLTHFAVEQNVGRGYIKELCYSRDGRIICSPFNRGMRLLGFGDNYEELTYCVPDAPEPLKVLVELKNYHPKIVVSCKFSPVDFTMVSGCLYGKIVWYKPVF